MLTRVHRCSCWTSYRRRLRHAVSIASFMQNAGHVGSLESVNALNSQGTRAPDDVVSLRRFCSPVD